MEKRSTSLLSVCINFKRLEQSQRTTFLSEPWDFAVWLDKVDDAGNRQMRHILLHLLFPQNFERIATLSHKKEIVDALASKDAVSVPEAPDDLSQAAQLDWKLAAIKRHFAETLGRDSLDFYDPPLSNLWGWGELAKSDLVETYREALEAHSDLLWNRFHTVAHDFQNFDNPGTPLRERELDYKHQTLATVADGIAELSIAETPTSEQSAALLILLKKANTKIVDFRAWDRTFGTTQESTHQVMVALWKYAHEELSTAKFFGSFKKEGLTPAWDGFSFALWCFNPERFFPIKISYFRNLSDTLGVSLKRQVTPNEKEFSNIISFATAIHEFLEPAGPRDWTDVHSFWWVCSQVYASPFDRLFPYGDADWILEDLESVLTAVTEAPRYKAKNLSITLRNASSSNIAISVSYGAYLIYRYGPRVEGGPFRLCSPQVGCLLIATTRQ